MTSFQFRLSLLYSKPSIWRRILVPDCSLLQFHQYLQAAMGWTNSHMFQFKIHDRTYKQEDCRATTLRELHSRGQLRIFAYAYDYGDWWEHNVEFEGTKEAEAPCCLDGAMNCPPENVGGVAGYEEFLMAIADSSHENHDDYREWAPGFDPKKFDPAARTEAMLTWHGTL